MRAYVCEAIHCSAPLLFGFPLLLCNREKCCKICEIFGTVHSICQFSYFLSSDLDSADYQDGVLLWSSELVKGELRLFQSRDKSHFRKYIKVWA